MPERSDDSDSSKRDPVRLYTCMVQTLEDAIGAEKLGAMFADLRASGLWQSLPLSDDEDVQRMLVRIGVLPTRESAARQGKLTEEFVRETSDAVSRSPAQVSIVMRIYASGWYGMMEKSVCGPTPRCPACGVTKLCDYFNAPPKRRPDTELVPGKRLARYGPQSLSDEDLVTLLIGSGRAGESHRAVASNLLKRFGGLRALFGAAHGELAALRDVSPSMALKLAVCCALHERIVSEQKHRGPRVRSGRDFYDLYHHELRDLRKEVFLVVLLDQKNRVMREERVSEGTLTNSLVHPREVFAPAIRESAASVAFVHNHPSGDSAPSPEDRKLTKRLCEAAELVGIRVLDHVIIGDNAFTSFVDEGWL